MPVAAECEEGLGPSTMQRVELDETALEPVVPIANVAAPETSRLRADLRAVQKAADRNDPEAFFAALAAAKETLADYPRGGERTAAEQTVRIYDDLARVWRHQLESPTGSFFTADSELYRAATSQPGFEESVRRQTYVDASQRRFYPTTETRRFLARAAEERLGIRTPAPSTAPRVASVTPRANMGRSSSVAAPVVTPSSRPARKPPVVVASIMPSRTVTRPSAASPVTSRAASPVTSSPVSTPPGAAAAVRMPAASSVSSPAPVAAADPGFAPIPAPAAAVAAPPPAVSEEPATASEAPVTVSEETASAPEDAEAPAAAKRGLLVPALLIVIGLGVLIVLFRAKG